MKIPINQIYETVQGEGHWTGTPAIFIRTQGCKVGCQWCDTKHTWNLNPDQIIPVKSMLAHGPTVTEDFAIAGLQSVMNRLKLSPLRHVVITGGEPLIHNLRPLVNAVQKDRRIQIETSGTEDIPLWMKHSEVWITVSPKIRMPGKREISLNTLFRANEIKMPIARPKDVDVLRKLIQLGVKGEVWIQPINQKPSVTKLCYDLSLLEGWNLSIQTQKYAKIP